ncbi:hypothetical protein HK097_004112 [Rhizophlyctis rosea]|uniref:Zn(2)-C6 fungal-type domain-containing protein n=1 Tax=Rhizophlyctis rosea TaxID=64517 RepID=A0AAD5X6L3_9FUNG|nr:hypothetical protein HK097_004112 [Rhizophlyctis rosea]
MDMQLDVPQHRTRPRNNSTTSTASHSSHASDRSYTHDGHHDGHGHGDHGMHSMYADGNDDGYGMHHDGGDPNSQHNMQGRSRQYQTAMKLKSAVGGNRVWACDRCYRQKVKCDSARPSCTPCKRKNTPCTYGVRDTSAGGAGGRKGRRYDTAGYIRMLEARLREVEDMVSGSGGKNGSQGNGNQGGPSQGSPMQGPPQVMNGGFQPMGYGNHYQPPPHPAPLPYGASTLPPPLPPASSSMHSEYYGHETYRPPPPPLHMLHQPPPLPLPNHHDRPPLFPQLQQSFSPNYPPQPYQYQPPLAAHTSQSSSSSMMGPFSGAPRSPPRSDSSYDPLPPPPAPMLTTHLPPPIPSYPQHNRRSFSRSSPPPPMSYSSSSTLTATYPPPRPLDSHTPRHESRARSEERQERQERSRSKPHPASIVTALNPEPNSPRSSPPASPTTASLFSLATLTPLVHLFFTYKYSTFFLLPIHPPTFMDNLTQQSPFLLYTLAAAVVSTTGCWKEVEVLRNWCRDKGIKRGEEEERLVDVYMSKARAMIQDEIEKPTVEGAIGLGCLGTAASFMGQAKLAHSFASMSVRMATELRLNIDPDVEEVHGNLTWLQKEARRRAWWTACVLDALDTNSNVPTSPTIHTSDHPRSDRIPFVNDKQNTVKAPAPEHLWQSVTCPDGLPNIGAFVPGSDLDLAEFTGRLAKVIGEYRRWRGRNAGKEEVEDPEAEQQAVSRRTSASSGNNSRSPTPPPKSFTLTSLPPHLAQLEQHLHSIVAALPPWARCVDNYTTFADSTIVKDPPPWQLLVDHIVYHGVVVGLYLPAGIDVTTGASSADLLKSIGERLTPPSSPPGTPGSGGSQRPVLTLHPIALHHSHRIAHLLRLALSADRELRYFSAWVLQFVFYSCVVLSVAVRSSAKARVGVEGGDGGAGNAGGVESMSQEEKDSCERDLDVHLRFFDVFRGSVVGRRVRAVVEEVVGRV